MKRDQDGDERRGKFIWTPRHRSKNAAPKFSPISRMWRTIIAVSTVVGIVIAIAGQIKTVSDFYKNKRTLIQEQLLEYSLKVDYLKYLRATSIIEKYYASDACVYTAIPWDFDGDGVSTDLFIRYAFVQDGGHCDKNDLYSARGQLKVALARRTASAYGAPMELKYRDLGNYDLESTEKFLIAKFKPLNSATIFAYHPQLVDFEKIGTFQNLMDEPETEKLRGFEIHRDLDGFVVRSPDGYGYIYWDQTKNFYTLSKSNGRNFLVNKHALYFNREIENNETDSSIPPLEYDGKALAFAQDQSATVYLKNSEHLVLDPRCIAKSGFQEVGSIVTTVILDNKAITHEVVCYYGEKYFFISFSSS